MFVLEIRTIHNNSNPIKRSRLKKRNINDKSTRNVWNEISGQELNLILKHATCHHGLISSKMTFSQYFSMLNQCL